MQLLEDRINKDGIVKEGNVLKVDSFLNHQMDIELYNEIGKEFRRLFVKSNMVYTLCKHMVYMLSITNEHKK